MRDKIQNINDIWNADYKSARAEAIVKNLTIIFLFFSVLFGCSGRSEKLLGNDVRLFKDTPVWTVAKAIKRGDTAYVRCFFEKNPELIDFQESKFGKSLLNWAVYSDYYSGVVVLAELGANPNLADKNSTTAFINAADNLVTSDYLRILLKKGGDVNFIVKNPERNRIGTPLIAAAWCRLESVKILIEAGADVNFQFTEGGCNNTALFSSFRGGKVEIIRYLIIEAGANFRCPFTTTIDGDSVYAVDCLRDLTFELNSEEYKQKMEIVDYLKQRGIDYWETPISPHFYKLYDKSYLDKY